MHPIVLTKLGTKEAPVTLTGVDPERYIACTGRIVLFILLLFYYLFIIYFIIYFIIITITGHPAFSHETVWLTLKDHKGKGLDRCGHCGRTILFYYSIIINISSGNVFKYTQSHDDHHH